MFERFIELVHLETAQCTNQRMQNVEKVKEKYVRTTFTKQNLSRHVITK